MEKEEIKIFLNHDRINRIAQYQKMIRYFNQKIADELSGAYKENGVKSPEKREGARGRRFDD